MQKIRQLREVAGMSQAHLARAVGCSQQSISSWETGYRAPNFLQGLRVAAALGVSPHELVDWSAVEPLPVPPAGRSS
jgi:DNA-binding XRE family transcriptional regulator